MVRTVRIGMIEMPPISTHCALDSFCLQRGLAVDAARIVCHALHWNCVFEWFPSSEYGDVDENGTSTGLVAAIQNGIYDTSLPVLTPTFRRSQAIDFSLTYFYFDTILTTRAPGKSGREELDWSLVNAFQWKIWVSFGVLFFLCGLLISLIAYKFTNDRNFWSVYFNFSVSLLKNDTDEVFTQSLPLRICYGGWLIASIVLTTSYTGMLFSRKVGIQNDHVPYTDMESFATCLEDGRCRLVTHTRSISTFQRLTTPGSDLSNRISRAIEKYPPVVIPLDKIPMAILEEKGHYLVWQWPREWVYYYTRGNKDCKYYIVETPFQEVDTFPMRKGSSLMNDLNNMSSVFTENDLGTALRQKYFRVPDCSQALTDGGGTVESDIGSLRTAFYFYALGIGCGVGAMMVELWKRRKTDLGKE